MSNETQVAAEFDASVSTLIKILNGARCNALDAHHRANLLSEWSNAGLCETDDGLAARPIDGAEDRARATEILIESVLQRDKMLYFFNTAAAIVKYSVGPIIVPMSVSQTQTLETLHTP